jgi:hypothetical protein
MTHVLLLVIMTLGALLCSKPILAQATADSISLPVSREFCFRGRPLPSCATFAVSEFGYGRSSVGETDAFVSPAVDPNVVFWELGLMRNVSAHSALGGTVLFTSRFSLGMKARYRRWLNREFSLDLAPGLTLKQEGNGVRVPSFTGHVGVNYGDWLGVGGMLEVSRFSPEVFLGTEATTVSKVFLVGRVGSYPGLITGGLAGAGLLVLGLLLAGVSD